jgi:ketosteroid isomerase-like protein
MRRIITLPMFVLVAALTSACAQPAPAPPPAAPTVDLAAEERALRAADAAWLKAAQAKDVAGEVSVLAPGATVIRQNQPAMDAAAFQAYITKDYAENPKLAANWTTDSIRMATSGEWAVQTGQYTATGLGAKGDGSDSGRFVTIWTKTGGAWKVQQDTSVSTMPATK